MILEQENIAEAAVASEIEHAIAKGPEQIFDALFGQVGERYLVIRAFDDHFMRADAAHAVIEAFALAVEHSFNAERRKLVRDHAQIPMPVAVFPIGEDFRRRIGFMAVAEGAASIGLGKIAGSG